MSFDDECVVIKMAVTALLLCESRDIVIVRDYHVSVSDNERMSSQTSKWLLSKTLTRLIHKSATSVVSYLIYSVNLIKHRQTLIVLIEHTRSLLFTQYLQQNNL